MIKIIEVEILNFSFVNFKLNNVSHRQIIILINSSSYPISCVKKLRFQSDIAVLDCIIF